MCAYLLYFKSLEYIRHMNIRQLNSQDNFHNTFFTIKNKFSNIFFGNYSTNFRKLLQLFYNELGNILERSRTLNIIFKEIRREKHP